MCFLAIYKSSLEKHLFRSSAHFFFLIVFVFLILSCMSCLYIFWRLILCHCFICSYFFLILRVFFFILFMVSFAMQKLVSLIRSHLFIFVFISIHSFIFKIYSNIYILKKLVARYTYFCWFHLAVYPGQLLCGSVEQYTSFFVIVFPWYEWTTVHSPCPNGFHKTLSLQIVI